jgi:outer membrane receptor protein involved in Fe transport
MRLDVLVQIVEARDARQPLTFVEQLEFLAELPLVDIDATQYEIGDVFVGVRQNQVSQELQFNYTTDRLKAVAGLYYLDERVKSHQEAYADDLLGPLYLNSGFLRTVDDRLRTKSYAGYANASFEVVPSVHVSGGIRFTRETKDYFRTTSTFYSVLPAFNGTYRFNPDTAGWNDTSPMVSVDWSPSKDSMVYARFAKGFKSGGFNGRANSVAESTEYDPETVKSYEAGFKTSWGNTVRINGAVFSNDYRNFQARVSVRNMPSTWPGPGRSLWAVRAVTSRAPRSRSTTRRSTATWKSKGCSRIVTGSTTPGWSTKPKASISPSGSMART